jgi:LemA protein
LVKFPLPPRERAEGEGEIPNSETTTPLTSILSLKGRGSKKKQEAAMNSGLKAVLIVLGVIAVIAIGVIMYGMGEYNKAVAMDEQVKSQWAQVDNQLKRRYDLLPNLVEITKGYAKHEKEVFTDIANARTKYFQASTVKDKIQSSQQLEGTLSRLLMLQETFPQLKANESFLKLQDEWAGTENRIAVERMRYNEIVKTVNTYRRTVMGRFFASLAGVNEAPYYDVPQAEKEAPKAKF